MTMIKIPHAFINDHRARCLPTPVIQRATRAHVFIRADDPALPELMDDARHYAEGGISATDMPHLFGLISSARATLRAIRKATVPVAQGITMADLTPGLRARLPGAK